MTSFTRKSSTTYTFKVRAVNGAGASDWVEATVVLFTTPSAPLNLAVEANNAAVMLQWEPPTANGGCDITMHMCFSSLPVSVGQLNVREAEEEMAHNP